MTLSERQSATGYDDTAWTTDVQDAVIESIFAAGDISRVAPELQAKHYDQVCRSMGLNPATMPLVPIRLNGKLVLYPGRGATDQLAAIHRINREIVEGPEVRDILGSKVGYAKCRATHPNGRTETAIATIPASDPAMLYMKLETKAKRRATLSILGLGMLDDAEVQDIPARDKGAGSYGPVGRVPPAVSAIDSGPLDALTMDDVRAELASAETLEAVVETYETHRQALLDETGDLDQLGYLSDVCCKHLDEHVGKGLRMKFKAALREHDETRRRATVAASQIRREPEAPARMGSDNLDEPPHEQPALDPVAQALSDYGLARSLDEIAAISADVAKLMLAKGSSAHRKLVAAYKAAVARVTPPTPPTPPTGSDAPSDAGERAAIEGAASEAAPAAESAAVASAADAWRAHLMSHAHPDAVCNSFCKHLHAGDYALPEDTLRRIAMDRLVALGIGGDSLATNWLRVAQKNYRPAKRAA
jgi:hypothetical protein